MGNQRRKIEDSKPEETQYGLYLIVACCVVGVMGIVVAIVIIAFMKSTSTATAETPPTLEDDPSDTSSTPVIELPTCSDQEVKKGYLSLSIRGFPTIALQNEKSKLQLEHVFRDLYNEITGMCLDPLARVLQSSALVTWDTDWGSVSSPTAYEEAVAASVTTTFWEATIACSGCPDHDSLFGGGELALRSRRRSLLQVDMDEFFPIFAASFSVNAVDGDATIQVVSGSTYDAADVIQEDGTLDFANAQPLVTVSEDTITEAIQVLEANGGTIASAFVSDDLKVMKDCLLLSNNNEDTAITTSSTDQVYCGNLLANLDNVEEEVLNECLDNPTALECQTTLSAVLDQTKDIREIHHEVLAAANGEQMSGVLSNSTASESSLAGAGEEAGLATTWDVTIEAIRGQTVYFDTGLGQGGKDPNIKIKAKDNCRYESPKRSLIGYVYPIAGIYGINVDDDSSKIQPGPDNTLKFTFTEGITGNTDIYTPSSNGDPTATISFCLEIGFYDGSILIDYAEARIEFLIHLTATVQVAVEEHNFEFDEADTSAMIIEP